MARRSGWAAAAAWGAPGLGDGACPSASLLHHPLPAPPSAPTTCLVCCCTHLPLPQVNYNLLAVNAFMAVTGIYQLQRKVRHDMAQRE